MEITAVGDQLKIVDGDKTETFPIGGFEIKKQGDDFIQIAGYFIRDYNQVTVPASTSLSDLYTKLNTLIQ